MSDCKGKLFGMVSLIFVSGMLGGAVTVKLAERYWWPQPTLVLQPEEKQVAVDHFARELSLDEAQARAIEAILDELIMQQADLMAQFRTTRVSSQDRIHQILNEEQRRRFQGVLSELSTRRQD